MKKDVNRVKSIKVSEIKNPQFLATLNYKELDELAHQIRNEILRVTSKYGGHLSSNLGVVEATIALHRVFDFSKDKIIFDVGHQCYTHKILTGRSLEGLRTKDGISGFQKMDESPYDHFECGHSSTSISAANGFAIARDLAHENYEVVAFIGDGSIASGLAFEALNNIAHSNHKVIVILNDNEMSISRPVGGLGRAFANISVNKGYNKMKKRYVSSVSKSKFGRFIYKITRYLKNKIKTILVPPTIFDTLGLAFIGPIDGHNIKDMEKAFKKAKNINRSVVIDICTIKGKGYSFAESDRTGYWHGVPPFDIKTGKPLDAHEGYLSWSHLMSDITLEEMDKNDKIVLVSPATLKGSGLEDIFEKYPDRCFDVGISEEHAATMSSALSLGGYHPVISIYSTFMQRAYDEISHDVARLYANATFLVDRSGLVGADGDTHQGIYDEAIFSATPNCVITMPNNKNVAKALFKESLNNHGPFFIRYPRDYIAKDEVEKDISLGFGKWLIEKEGKGKVALIGVGPLLNKVKELVNQEKLDVSIYNAVYLCPIDKECLDKMMKFNKIVIYNPYSTRGGMVNNVISYLVSKGYKGEIVSLAIPNKFVKQATIKQQLEEFNLLPEQIISYLK